MLYVQSECTRVVTSGVSVDQLVVEQVRVWLREKDPKRVRKTASSVATAVDQCVAPHKEALCVGYRLVQVQLSSDFHAGRCTMHLWLHCLISTISSFAVCNDGQHIRCQPS